jgi:hypothetical protein
VNVWVWDGEPGDLGRCPEGEIRSPADRERERPGRRF